MNRSKNSCTFIAFAFLRQYHCAAMPIKPLWVWSLDDMIFGLCPHTLKTISALSAICVSISFCPTWCAQCGACVSDAIYRQWSPSSRHSSGHARGCAPGQEQEDGQPCQSLFFVSSLTHSALLKAKSDKRDGSWKEGGGSRGREGGREGGLKDHLTCPGVSPVCQSAFLRCSPGPVVELTTLMDSPE